MYKIFLIALVAVMLSPSAIAGKITIFQATEGDFNLLEFPGKLVSGSLVKKPSYFTGVSYSESVKNILDPYLSVVGLSQEVEYQISRHYGVGFSDIYEINNALILRTNNINLVGDYGFNISSGIGLSYTLSDPVYEKEVGGENYKFQSHLSFGVEFVKKHSNYSIPLRIHHRSGIYGLIAPGKVGSNFVSIGLKFKL